MKGVILSSDLYPVPKAMSKKRVPIYDKPMIYYPMSVSNLTGIVGRLIILTLRYIVNFKGIFKYR